MKTTFLRLNMQWLIALGCLALGMNVLRAGHGTWAVNESGNWSDTSKWANSTVADLAGSTAFFNTVNITTTRTVTLDSSRTIGAMVFGDASGSQMWQLSSSGGATMTMDNGSAVPGLRCTHLVTVNTVLAGVNGLRSPDQEGVVTLNSANTYTGNTEIRRGTIRLANTDALPSGSRTGDIYMLTGGNDGNYARLDLNNLDITINGLNSIITNESGSFVLPVVTSSNATAGVSTLTVGDNNANGTYDGVIANGATRTLALVKTGNGKQVFNGSLTHSGGTTINGGILEANDSLGSGPVTVNTGGTLQGKGTISGPVTVNNGGKIGAGSSAGQLSFYGELNLADGGTFEWELAELADDTGGNPGGTHYDQLIAWGDAPVLGGTSKVHLNFIDGTPDPDSGNPFWSSPHTWTLIQAGLTPNGNFAQVVNHYDGRFSTALSGNNVVLTYTPSAITRPRITSISGAGTASVTVSYTNTIPGTNYVLRFSTNLNTPNWTVVGTKQAVGTGDSQTDNPPAGTPRRFYRVHYVTQ